MNLLRNILTYFFRREDRILAEAQQGEEDSLKNPSFVPKTIFEKNVSDEPFNREEINLNILMIFSKTFFVSRDSRNFLSYLEFRRRNIFLDESVIYCMLKHFRRMSVIRKLQSI